jgi:hemoglobin/transferrin/lactoferrin receptor protein
MHQSRPPGRAPSDSEPAVPGTNRKTILSSFTPGVRKPSGQTCTAIVGCLGLLLGSPPSMAADPPGTGDDQEPLLLEPMVAVVTRDGRPLSEIAGTVTVLTREELDQNLTTSLDQVFRYTPGIDTTTTGTRFGAEGLIIRGIGGNRVAMELDGVPLSQQFAIGNFSNATRDLVDVGLIERIEVLHGPASALYGSSALGGVVSMKTPDPGPMDIAAGGTGLSLSQGYQSSDDSWHTVGAATAGTNRMGGLGMIGVRSGHEPDAKAADAPDHRDFDNRSGLAKATFDTAGGHRLRGLYYHHDSKVRTDMQSVLGTGRFASTTLLQGDDRYRLDLLAGEMELAPSRFIDGGVLRAWSEITDIRQDTVDERGAAARPVSIDRRFDYQQDTVGVSSDLRRTSSILGLQHQFAVGGEWTTSRIKESRGGTETGLEDGLVTGTVLGETFPVRDFPATDANETGLYVYDEVGLGRARLIAAVRYDHYDLDPDPDAVYREDNPATEVVSITDDEISPKLGLVWQFTPTFDGWLQYAHGFRAPSFEDANIGLDIPMFNIRAIPNPDLKPETSDGVEAGLRWRGPGTQVNASVFYTRYDDFIETKVRLGVDPESGRLLFQSQNIDRATVYGAELAAELSLDAWLRGISLKAAAYWARGENRESDEPLNSVGPAQAVLALGWTAPGGRSEATLMGTLTRRNSRLDEVRGELFEAPGYAVFDLFLSQRIGRHLLLRGGVENLLDRTYWQWADVRGLAPDDPVVPLLSQPGRSVSMDLRWNF